MRPIVGLAKVRSNPNFRQVAALLSLETKFLLPPLYLGQFRRRKKLRLPNFKSLNLQDATASWLMR